MRRLILVPVLGFIFAATAAVAAADAIGQGSLLTPERAVKYRRISDVHFSADGASAVCVFSEAIGPQLESHIWMINVKRAELHQLTYSPKVERSPEWSPKDDTVAFLSNRSGRYQVYVIPRAGGGEAHAVTNNPTGVGSFHWSPDGSRIAYLAREPGSDVDPNAAHVADRPEDVERLWVVDVATGEVRRITDGKVRIDDFGWLSDSRVAAVASERPADETWNTAIYGISMMGTVSPAAVSLIGHPNQPFTRLTVSPTGRQFGFTSTDHQGPIEHDLFIQNVEAASARNVTASLDRYVLEMHWQDESNVYFRYANGFFYSLARLDSRGLIKRIDLPYTVRAFDVARDGKLIFVGTRFNQLPELFLRQPNGAVAQVGEAQAGWAGVHLNDAEFFHTKSFDGTDIESALMKPRDQASNSGAKAPLVVFAHGGPASSFNSDYFWFNAWPQLLAARGYQVLMVNPRGSVGYGENFLKANRADLGGGDYKDIMAAVDAVIARGEVDPERLGFGGWSYGAQMTQWVIGHTDRFKAAVSGQGVFDESFEFYTEAGPADDEWYFGTPWEHPDVYARNSPSTFIRNAKTPTLIIHMEGDVTNPLAQSQSLYRALKHMGVETTLVTYAENSHLPQQEQHQIDVMKRMIDWYDRHLK